MQNGNGKPPSHGTLKRYIIFFILSILLAVTISIRYPFYPKDYQLGDIARSNIKSPVDLFIPSTDSTIKKGEIIVREGERIDNEALNKLSTLKLLHDEEGFTLKKFLSLLVILFMSIVLLYEYAARTIKKFVLTHKDIIFCALFLIFMTLLIKVLQLFFNYIYIDTAHFVYIIPILLFGIILRTVFFSEAAIIFSIFFSITVSLTFNNSFPILLYTLIGSILASFFSGRCETRNAIVKAGLYSAFFLGIFVVFLGFVTGDSIADAPPKVAFILLNGIGSSFIALGLLPVIENLFGYTTDIKLLELANLEHPLLKEMMVDAPGTYHHSIIIGNLSEAAAESIGAHPLLTRVSAYYHDIGKLKMPHYFIENKTDFEDAHKSLTPSMSALIILSHVKEGVELAEKYKLGRKITEIIAQHHGTRLVSFFYNRAKEQEDPKLHIVEEKDFRYAGPKPQTKEAGIVMLADAVEAASRLLEDPTPKRIESHVQQIIENIFLDGQLDECELTLKDLHAIQNSFIKILLGIFHHRVEYPERVPHDGNGKKLSKNTKNGYGESAKDHRRFAKLFRTAR